MNLDHARRMVADPATPIGDWRRAYIALQEAVIRREVPACATSTDAVGETTDHRASDE